MGKLGTNPERGVDRVPSDVKTDVLIDLTEAEVAPATKPAVDLDLHRWSDWMPRVSLVIPTMNEASNLPHVLPRIPTWVAEVIIVDGQSTDDTVGVATSLIPDAIVIHQTGSGKGDAMRLGFEAATGDIIASIDADGSMDPAELHVFVGQLMAGADFVKGSRFAQGGGTVDMEIHRKMGNWGLVRLTRLLFGQRYSDLCYGYMAFWRRALDIINPDSEGFEIEALMNARALRARLKIAEVPSFEARRIHGVSNLKTFRDGWRILSTLLSERFTRQDPPASAK
ncbi:MAG TPA: glycosyltransferase family 2 protein [Acidimicrobiia bacterium]|nr:glycosyltransferase family 2 protein [Acidimicrobiia bacterium]